MTRNKTAVQEGRLIKPARYFLFKEWLGRLLAAVLLLPGLPIIGLLMLAMRLTSRGAGIYRQARVGKDGRVFTMLKIRTMVVDAEARTGPVWSAQNDPRVTPLGRILRKLHLDELPQLINVVRGEMALVGPRPERPEIVEQLAECIPGYYRRLSVLPGITGLAQINLPPDTDLESVRSKLVLDLEYVHEAGLFLDARMLACSFLRLMGIPGEPIRDWLMLRREPVVPPSWRRATEMASVIAVAAAEPAVEVELAPEVALPATGASEPWPVMHVTPLSPR